MPFLDDFSIAIEDTDLDEGLVQIDTNEIPCYVTHESASCGLNESVTTQTYHQDQRLTLVLYPPRGAFPL